MILKQAFTPGPGRIAIVVDRETATIRRAAGAGIEVADETRDRERAFNPWALVVGVGKPETTQYGTTVTTDVEEGDFVAFARVGMNLWLDDGDGGDFVYVVPFAGILGRLLWACPSCKTEFRKRPETVPNCPSCPTLIAPTLMETRLVGLK